MVTTFECKTSSKKELASAYGMGKDTFRRWCLRCGLDFGRRKVLEPAEVQKLVLTLGPPTLLIQWPVTAGLVA